MNGSEDRETSGFSASCFVTAVTDALNRAYGDPQKSLKNSVSQSMQLLLQILIWLERNVKVVIFLLTIIISIVWSLLVFMI